MAKTTFRAHTPYVPKRDALEAVRVFADRLALRRSVRHFASTPVDQRIIETAVRAAGTAPSGAHKQPWCFVCVSDPAVKSAIREAAEAEERAFYEERAPQRWLDDLRPFGTDANKDFLDIAPWLIVVFAKTRTEDGGQTYYVNESVGIATGMLLTALHEAGLATLTHTPSPMGFLRDVLGRPRHERPFLLIPVGWPAAGCQVPDLQRKPLDEIAVFVNDG